MECSRLALGSSRHELERYRLVNEPPNLDCDAGGSVRALAIRIVQVAGVARGTCHDPGRRDYPARISLLAMHQHCLRETTGGSSTNFVRLLPDTTAPRHIV